MGWDDDDAALVVRITVALETISDSLESIMASLDHRNKLLKESNEMQVKRMEADADIVKAIARQ